MSVGNGAHGVTIAPDGSTAYVTNLYANTNLGNLSAGKSYLIAKVPNGIPRLALPFP